MAKWPVNPEIDLQNEKREVYAAIRRSVDGYDWITAAR